MVERTLQQKVAELEERLASDPPGRLSSSASPDIRRLRKERDELKETICGFETELMQVKYCLDCCILPLLYCSLSHSLAILS